MECYGFARAPVAGEYSPKPYFTSVTSDITTAVTSFATILSQSVFTDENDWLEILFTCSFDITGSTGNTPTFQITVDGTVYAGVRQTCAGTSDKHAAMRVLGLQPGRGTHTVTVDWRSANTSTARIRAVSDPSHHGSLLCRVIRRGSDREMGGYPQLGWQRIYTCGLSQSDTTTTATSGKSVSYVSLNGPVTVVTRAPNSSLLIRLSASGSATLAFVYFQCFVDGVSIGGTSISAPASPGRFGGGFVFVAPVVAGTHTVDIKWTTNTAASATITPSATTEEHAEFTIEEVFCLDQGNWEPDAEGFAVVGYNAHTLPRVGFASLGKAFTGTASFQTVVSLPFYVAGDQSYVSIEYAIGLHANTTAAVNTQILVDGNVQGGMGANVLDTSGTSTDNFAGACNLVPLATGNHTIALQFKGNTSTIGPVANPDRSGAFLLVREIASPLAVSN